MCYPSEMSPPPGTLIRERRWLLLAEEGSHSWLGRNTDPDEEDLDRAEAALIGAGVGGWVAVSEGDYWGRGAMTLLQVRELNNPRTAFEVAVQAFMARRMDLVGRGSEPSSQGGP